MSEKKLKAVLKLESGKEIEVELTKELSDAVLDLVKEEKKWPREGDNEYYWLGNSGDIFDTYFLVGNDIDERRFNIGNIFKTAQQAKNMVRALKLIEAVRQDRLEMNGDWKPDWGSRCYVICINGVVPEVAVCLGSIQADALGYYHNEGDVRAIIDKYRDELTWYFTKFLPERG